MKKGLCQTSHKGKRLQGLHLLITIYYFLKSRAEPGGAGRSHRATSLILISFSANNLFFSVINSFSMKGGGGATEPEPGRATISSAEKRFEFFNSSIPDLKLFKSLYLLATFVRSESILALFLYAVISVDSLVNNFSIKGARRGAEPQ